MTQENDNFAHRQWIERSKEQSAALDEGEELPEEDVEYDWGKILKYTGIGALITAAVGVVAYFSLKSQAAEAQQEAQKSEPLADASTPTDNDELRSSLGNLSPNAPGKADATPRVASKIK